MQESVSFPVLHKSLAHPCSLGGTACCGVPAANFVLRWESFMRVSRGSLILAYEAWPICGDGLDLELRLTPAGGAPCLPGPLLSLHWFGIAASRGAQTCPCQAHADCEALLHRAPAVALVVQLMALVLALGLCTAPAEEAGCVSQHVGHGNQWVALCST